MTTRRSRCAPTAARPPGHPGPREVRRRTPTTRSAVTTVTIDNDATPSAESRITFASDDEVKAPERLADAVVHFFDKHNPGELGPSEKAFDTAGLKLDELRGAPHRATHP